MAHREKHVQLLAPAQRVRRIALHFQAGLDGGGVTAHREQLEPIGMRSS
jgi:hypothetical protein